jgi:hypothetical protein
MTGKQWLVALESITEARAEIERRTPDPADAETQQDALRASIWAAWSTLAGMILSAAAAIGGAFVGSGPTFRFVGWTDRSSVVINRSNLVAQR